MAAVSAPTPKLDRFIVVHVATTCDEHGVYVTKDSAEVIEFGWILLDTKTCEEVRSDSSCIRPTPLFCRDSCKLCLRIWPTYIPQSCHLHAANEGFFGFLATPGECPCQARQHSDHAALQ